MTFAGDDQLNCFLNSWKLVGLYSEVLSVKTGTPAIAVVLLGLYMLSDQTEGCLLHVVLSDWKSDRPYSEVLSVNRYPSHRSRVIGPVYVV